jgi:hypothetical protein
MEPDMEELQKEGFGKGATRGWPSLGRAYAPHPRAQTGFARMKGGARRGWDAWVRGSAAGAAADPEKGGGSAARQGGRATSSRLRSTRPASLVWAAVG